MRTNPAYENEYFLKDGEAVGILMGVATLEPGRWRYEPYRGAGHYELVTQVRAGELVECYLDTDRGSVGFVVSGIPEYGVLEVIQVSPPQSN